MLLILITDFNFMTCPYKSVSKRFLDQRASVLQRICTSWQRVDTTIMVHKHMYLLCLLPDGHILIIIERLFENPCNKWGWLRGKLPRYATPNEEIWNSCVTQVTNSGAAWNPENSLRASSGQVWNDMV